MGRKDGAVEAEMIFFLSMSAFCVQFLTFVSNYIYLQHIYIFTFIFSDDDGDKTITSYIDTYRP